MKKIFSMMAAAIVCVLMTACSSEIDKKCGELANAMVAGNVEESTTIAEQIYTQKDKCTAGNLADLSLAYNFLANQTSDNTLRYENAKKVVDCYKAAVAKDADVAKKCYETAQVDMASIAQQYEQMFPQFEAAIAAQNAATTDAATTDEEVEVAEEEVAE